MTGCLPIFLQMKGGGGREGAGGIPLPVTSESVCSLRVAGSPTPSPSRRELADLTRKWHGPA